MASTSASLVYLGSTAVIDYHSSVYASLPPGVAVGTSASSELIVTYLFTVSATAQYDFSYTMDSDYTLVGADSQVFRNLFSYHLVGESSPNRDGGTFFQDNRYLSAANAGTPISMLLDPGYYTLSFSTGDASTHIYQPGSAAVTEHDTFTVTANSAVAAVPEPAIWALMMIGMGGVGASLRTRRRKNVAV